MEDKDKRNEEEKVTEELRSVAEKSEMVERPNSFCQGDERREGEQNREETEETDRRGERHEGETNGKQ